MSSHEDLEFCSQTRVSRGLWQQLRSEIVSSDNLLTNIELNEFSTSRNSWWPVYRWSLGWSNPSYGSALEAPSKTIPELYPSSEAVQVLFRRQPLAKVGGQNVLIPVSWGLQFQRSARLRLQEESIKIAVRLADPDNKAKASFPDRQQLIQEVDKRLRSDRHRKSALVPCILLT